ncbi:uncharacterized protein Z518_00949 [Rhinocladiella mackenziei CBS 650.93]|uniref:Rhinocladiella mackenziei CBS 650.93 unplaced genomic scaffold supercont1.1, whole genome shotgun sequence n=1 Tax=Rhinocladiella mackenziei CBS 650.93 TaxID=1442369 RepID=A0A0D2HGR5_9EURO|nr:uncharacterized protein Z518_00949 [Rhinocladiella mackenziei CBS 650.93]KIX09868.1 hypothetical protein Z518_00949 [Rhinocladiella mackenziei CBS 650.93]
MTHIRGVPDESRPTCKRCEKAGYTCGGYEKKLELRFHTFAAQSDPNAPAPTKTSKTPPPAAKPGVPSRLVLRSNDNQQDTVPPDMSLVAFKDNIQFSYLFDNFVWSSYGTPWLQMSAEGKIDALSLEACRAFSLSIFGKHHHQPDIEVSGAVHYDKTVRALSSRLSNVGAPGSEALIVPIMILLMHSSTTPDPQASAFHIQGLLKLIQICGPQRFAVDPLRLAFESCRATLITVSLITKTRSFLEQPAWLTEPWSARSDFHKNAQNQLVDILVYIPGFLQDQSQLEQSPSDQFKQSLIQRIEYQIAKAYNWRWSWEELNPNVAWEVDPEMLPSDQFPLSPSRVVRKVLMFSSFSKAAEIALYNATLLCLLGLLWTMKSPEEDSPSPITLSQTPLFLPGELRSLTEPAIEISRAFEFQLANVKRSRDSALFWLFPLGLASRVLEDNPDYITWIKSMLDSSQVTRGYGTGGNTYGFGFYKFPKIMRKKTNVRPMIQAQYGSDSIRQHSEGSSDDE